MTKQAIDPASAPAALLVDAARDLARLWADFSSQEMHGESLRASMGDADFDDLDSAILTVAAAVDFIDDSASVPESKPVRPTGPRIADDCVTGLAVRLTDKERGFVEYSRRRRDNELSAGKRERNRLLDVIDRLTR